MQMKRGCSKTVPRPRRLDEDEGEDGGELPAREAAAARDLAHGRGGVDVEQHPSQSRITSLRKPPPMRTREGSDRIKLVH